MHQLTRFSALVAAFAMSASAAVFQYTVSVPTGKGDRAAFLWIPPAAEQVRGVVMAGMTLMEREFVQDARIRESCATARLAIVFLSCGLKGTDALQALDALGEASGYRELSVAPLFFVGHSAGGSQAKAYACELADRCFGLVQYRGGGPGGDPTVPAGVPTLVMTGQFDEFGGLMRDEAGREGAWENARDDLAAYRRQDGGHLASMVVEPGAGHFAWSEPNARYLAMFIRKAATARIPDWPLNAAEPVPCKEINRADGWLAPLPAQPAHTSKATPYGQYKGDKATAGWHFDQEIAEATVAFHRGLLRKDQFIRWQDRYWVDAGARYFFLGPKWIGDGQTIEVHPAYADVYPSQHRGQGPHWLAAGQPVGHCDAPILVKRVSGPIVATGPNTLRIQYSALAGATDGTRITFMAYSDGDDEYRHTERVGMMPRGFKGLTKGKTQTIVFPPIGDLGLGSAPAELKATSDSGLPVEYYAAYGPAIVAEGKLRVSELPVRATFPIEVQVVAYQFGSGLEPFVKMAAPVAQTVLIRGR